jgi:putative CocE/NonD family hydrolase
MPGHHPGEIQPDTQIKAFKRKLAGCGLILFCLWLPFASAVWAADSESETADTSQNRVDFSWGLKIPMRDGVELNATLYRPAGAGPLPVIFGMTPYISASYHSFGMYYAKNGYVMVVADARGRGNSGGEFHPFLQDANDGFDAVEWLAKQPWSNGKLTMFGGSYSGSNQWATAKEMPPHLQTIVPTAPAFAGLDFPGVNNIMRSYDMQWLTFTSGHTGNATIFGDSEFWSSRYLDLYQGKVTFRNFDEWVGNPSKIYQRWLNHPSNDEYWDSITPTDAQFRQINLPILSITGAYDGDQPGTLEFYRRHMSLGSDQAKNRHYLVIGPWDHSGTRFPQPTIGGLEIGDSSLWDMNEFSKEWYDWTLKGGPKPDKLTGKVVYFVAGLNEWKSSSALMDIGARKQTLYLDSKGTASPTAYRSGALGIRPPPDREPAYFFDDPLATHKTAAREKDRAADYHHPEWVIYQDNVLAIEEDGLVYHTEPFAEPAELSGFAEAQLWLSMDVKDTDIRVSLFEIFPEERLVNIGKIERYDFKRFTFFSRQIGKGSRLRLVIDGNDSSAWQQNYNSGGVVSDETPADAKTATINLHQDPRHRSVLLIPLGT